MKSTPLYVLALAAAVAAPLSAQDTERLYQQACDRGDLIACNVFGLMYEHGEGVARDPTRAAVLYERACEGGELVGCTNLGLLYELGVGVPWSLSRAVGLYQVACEGGETLGCSSLAEVGRTLEAGAGDRHYKAGRVGDAATGAPLADAVVRLPEIGVRVVSDAAGRIELAGIPAGRYRLVAERAGYELLEGRLEVPGSTDFVVLLTRDALDELDAPGRVVGRVTDEGGQAGLGDVEITVHADDGASTLSDPQGRFALTDVEPGLVRIAFTRLGYAPRTATLVVQPGRTVDLQTTMFTEPIELEAMEVTVRSSYLERAGFYDRLERSSGSFFTSDDLERIDPIEVSDLIRRVPGVRLMRFSELEPNRLYAVSRRSKSPSQGPCVLPVFVDGVRRPDPVLDQVPPRDVEAIEMYGGFNAPMQYGENPCGVVLIWTKVGAPTGR